MKTIVQCDFDGTITEKDVSFLILDTYADGDWRKLFKDYTDGKIPVGTFNRRAFGMVKADKDTLIDLILKSDEVQVRPGFRELLDYCAGQGLKVAIVSNGLDFYIEAILKKLGIDGLDFYAATSRFLPEGMEVGYIGPGGVELEVGFKDAYTEKFHNEGYRVVYVGNGVSDLYPARKSDHIFAIGDLLDQCRLHDLPCVPFNDLHDVVKGLANLVLG
jgi:2-hydroxy-3-keto-5-methylthiopentenyl-1-phosphate phosphatase